MTLYVICLYHFPARDLLFARVQPSLFGGPGFQAQDTKPQVPPPNLKTTVQSQVRPYAQGSKPQAPGSKLQTPGPKPAKVLGPRFQASGSDSRCQVPIFKSFFETSGQKSAKVPCPRPKPQVPGPNLQTPRSIQARSQGPRFRLETPRSGARPKVQASGSGPWSQVSNFRPWKQSPMHQGQTLLVPCNLSVLKSEVKQNPIKSNFRFIKNLKSPLQGIFTKCWR